MRTGWNRNSRIVIGAIIALAWGWTGGASAAIITAFSGAHNGPNGGAGVSHFTFTPGVVLDTDESYPLVFGTVTVSDLNVDIDGFVGPTDHVVLADHHGGSQTLTFRDSDLTEAVFGFVGNATLMVTGPTSGRINAVLQLLSENTAHTFASSFWDFELVFTGLTVETGGTYIAKPSSASSFSMAARLDSGLPVPEPASLAAWSGLALLGYVARRRKLATV